MLFIIKSVIFLEADGILAETTSKTLPFEALQVSTAPTMTFPLHDDVCHLCHLVSSLERRFLSVPLRCMPWPRNVFRLRQVS